MLNKHWQKNPKRKVYILSQWFPSISQFKRRLYFRESSPSESFFILAGRRWLHYRSRWQTAVLGLVQHRSDSEQWHLVVTLHSLCCKNLQIIRSFHQLFNKQTSTPTSCPSLHGQFSTSLFVFSLLWPSFPSLVGVQIYGQARFIFDSCPVYREPH